MSSIPTEWFVSYAWGEDTEAGRALDKVVNDICAAAEQRGLRIRRDRNEMAPGDSIAAFMRKIGEGDRVFVVLSVKYLRSPWCMFELFEVWQNCRGREREFLDRIRVFVLPDAKISNALDRSDHAIFWQDEHDRLEARIKERPASVGRRGYETYHQMGRFYHEVADILASIADMVRPRTLEEFVEYGFDDAGTNPGVRRPGPGRSAPAAPPVSPSRTPPVWADYGGDDEYGKWASFSVTGVSGARVTQRLRWCPPGRFMMGSPENEKGRNTSEGPRHEVVFARGFWMFDTVCTQALWDALMSDNPSRRNVSMLPVTDVSWDDARRFVERLNAAKPGLGLDLPSEAHWEYACRAGTDTAYSFGPEISMEQVNYHSRGTVSVSSLPPNAWGLHEMHGNVWEWCADKWHGNYNGAPADGSAWIDEETDSRVFRGGSWRNEARGVRAAFRGAGAPSHRGGGLGFRCARVQ